MKGITWIRGPWSTATRLIAALVIFIAGGFATAVINKIIENNDLEWLKAIWLAVWGFVVGVYGWLLSSAPIPIWLIVPVVALALVPVLQLAKRVRIAATAPPEITLTRTESMVLGAIQAMDETRRHSATLDAIAEHTTLALLRVEVALDSLNKYEFIKCAYPMNSPISYSLKAGGRAYLLDKVLTHVW